MHIQVRAVCVCVFLSICTAVIQAVRSVAFQLLNLVEFQLLKLNLVKGNTSSLKHRVSIVPGARQEPFAFSAMEGRIREGREKD